MKLNYLVLSDVHFGHRKTKTSHIVASLDAMFSNYTSQSQFTDLDFIFIAGDLFDRLLSFTDTDIHEACLWLGRLMYFCLIYNIKLRILEGTPSHDWKQSSIGNTIQTLTFEKMIDGVAKGIDRESLKDLDFKYIDTLYIEHVKDLQLHILYVPDEWTASSELTFKQVKELLAHEGIDQVDIAIMHGMFGYQVQNIPGIHGAHDEVSYLNIVKNFINIGHHHTFSFNGRIVAQGSVDRLAHGQEEDKGMCLMHIDDEQGNRFEFIKNPLAKPYVTVDLKNADLDKSLAKLDKTIAKLPKDSYIRIRAAIDHPVIQAFEEIKLRYFDYNLDRQVEKDETEVQSSLVVEAQGYVPVTIIKDNVVSLLIEEIKRKSIVDPARLVEIEEILVELRDS